MRALPSPWSIIKTDNVCWAILTSAPLVLFMGLMIAAISLAYVWEQRPSAGRRWSPLQLLGRSSLFVYWVHVELVYGLISRPLHRAFPLWGAWVALAVVCLFMLWLAAQKERLANKYRRGRELQSKLRHKAQALMF